MDLPEYLKRLIDEMNEVALTYSSLITRRKKLEDFLDKKSEILNAKQLELMKRQLAIMKEVEQPLFEYSNVLEERWILEHECLDKE